eukprot:526354-Pelagomonas_calceolata.AAC.3
MQRAAWKQSFGARLAVRGSARGACWLACRAPCQLRMHPYRSAGAVWHFNSWQSDKSQNTAGEDAVIYSYTGAKNEPTDP